jgi:hypothetical protein
MKLHRLALLLIAALSITPRIASATTTLVDSRAAATAMNLSTSSVVITGGYAAAGDGGGAVFKNVGSTTLLDTGASFTDAGGTNWQYVPDPIGIHIRQFGAKCDWNLSQDSSRAYSTYDAAATNDRAALQNAIDFAALQFANGDDVGGGSGRVVRIPKGACKISTQVRVADKVVLKGEGPLSSVLVMPQNFSTSDHFIILGNGSQLASFGSRLEDLQLWSVNTNAAYNVAMVYSDNTQHTGGLFRVKIFAGNRSAIYLNGGYGGASMYYMEHVETFNVGAAGGANGNPGIILHYTGSIIQNLRNLVVQGPGNGGSAHIGLRIDGGQVKVDGFHTEGIAIGIDVNVSGGTNTGFTRLVNLTGGSDCINLIQIESGTTANTTIVGMAAPNGCSNKTVLNGIPGGTSVTGVMIDDTKF